MLAGLAAVTAVLIAFCSARDEEHRAGLDIVFPPKPEPEAAQEDYVIADVLSMSDEEINARLMELDATTNWGGLARRRRKVRRPLKPTDEPFDVDKEGL